MDDNKLKLSLIRATESVRKKFKKLHDDRLERRHILEEQYRPITQKIKTLIATTTSKTSAVDTDNAREPLNSTSASQHEFSAINNLGDHNDNYTSANNETPNKSIMRLQPHHQSQLGVENQMSDISANDNGYDAEGSYAMFLNNMTQRRGTPTAPKPKRARSQISSSSSLSTNENIIAAAKKRKKIEDEIQPDRTLRVKLIRYKDIHSLSKHLQKKKKKKINSSLSSTETFEDGREDVCDERKKDKKAISPKYSQKTSDSKRKSTSNSFMNKAGDGLIDSDIMIYNNNNNNKSYVYWDNANELCERLRLLIASQNAGHTGHQNEIVSIIEELRETKIII